MLDFFCKKTTYGKINIKLWFLGRFMIIRSFLLLLMYVLHPFRKGVPHILVIHIWQLALHLKHCLCLVNNGFNYVNSLNNGSYTSSQI